MDFFLKEIAVAEREELKIQADQNGKKKFGGNCGCWFNENTKNGWIEMLSQFRKATTHHDILWTTGSSICLIFFLIIYCKLIIRIIILIMNINKLHCS